MLVSNLNKRLRKVALSVIVGAIVVASPFAFACPEGQTPCNNGSCCQV